MDGADKQKEIIEGLIRTQNLELKQDTKIEEDTAIEQNTVIKQDNVIEEDIVTEQDTGMEEKPSFSENAAVKLYDTMVDYLKQQRYIELQWVRVYAVKCPQEVSMIFK
ncbi:hypothetical protein [Acetivibrio straminisolvens]|uniref:Uncharacterized protein n=1 Tax=Acetivibrio straminisolvens JCM 21531 TaxID=1294263 RepID=W4VA19_9FIRM|nr:hypothetical protein [Acetivibrio straminisolvens]GAE90032.1 hypothetical protein JCM21531_3612 [Acetivibrio straminisolvens JCM 21531]